MIGTKNIIAAINENVSVPVYESSVPESITSVAIAVYNVAYASTSRDGEGRKSRTVETWRAEVVGTSLSEIESIVNEFDLMDGYSNSNYQKIYCQLVNVDRGTPDNSQRRAFIDLRAYIR